MDGPAPGTVLLFLSGDTALAARRAALPVPQSLGRRLFLPSKRLIGRAQGPPPASEEGDADEDDLGGRFAPVQVACAQRLLDAARPQRLLVRVVDVNDPGADRAAVVRFVHPEDVLPIAVRADGSRLVGEESFSRAELRRFLATA